MTEPKPRGRPRSFDEDTVLEALLLVFWTKGYAATSLDDLAAASGLNRPSLYAAFGHKQQMYERALSRFDARMRAGMTRALAGERSLTDDLADFFASALAVHLSGPGPAKGCLFVCTASSEAVSSPEIRAILARVVDDLDRGLAARFALARRRGELPKSARPRVLAPLAVSVLHGLAVRARAGADPDALRAFARGAAEVLGTPGAA